MISSSAEIVKVGVELSISVSVAVAGLEVSSFTTVADMEVFGSATNIEAGLETTGSVAVEADLGISNSQMLQRNIPLWGSALKYSHHK